VKILKGFTGQSFGEIVGKLFFGVNLLDLDVSAAYGMPKVMLLDMEVCGARLDPLVHRASKSAIVIFQDSAPDRRLEHIFCVQALQTEL
jgi:hypothetical protein